MNDNKTALGLLEELESLITGVTEDMCDNFCKYAETDETEICNKCPLDRLYKC